MILTWGVPGKCHWVWNHLRVPALTAWHLAGMSRRVGAAETSFSRASLGFTAACQFQDGRIPPPASAQDTKAEAAETLMTQP